MTLCVCIKSRTVNERKQPVFVFLSRLAQCHMTSSVSHDHLQPHTSSWRNLVLIMTENNFYYACPPHFQYLLPYGHIPRLTLELSREQGYTGISGIC